MQTTLPGHSWFMIMCSWEPDVDGVAEKIFIDVYENFLFKLTEDGWRDSLIKTDSQNPLLDLDSESFRALNLIGRHQFVLIGQATSNRVQQQLALKIGLGTGIKVDVFPATLVHDLYKVMK